MDQLTASSYKPHWQQQPQSAKQAAAFETELVSSPAGVEGCTWRLPWNHPERMDKTVVQAAARLLAGRPSVLVPLHSTKNEA